MMVLRWIVTALVTMAVLLDCQVSNAREVFYQSGATRLKGELQTPTGKGPFPAVIYLHGGVPPKVGGDPAATARALAKEGFIGFGPIRKQTVSLAGNIQDVIAAIEYVKKLENVDVDRLAVVGFSRGGLLAFMAATRRNDLKAIVMMAPAPGKGTLVRFLPQASRVTASTLILVASNDTRQADHVTLSRQTHAALEKAGKPVRLVVYPAFGRDGHLLFFQVRQPYWADVVKFLKDKL